jgi:RimJ/RimL family protein N-acetyltransferase
MNTMNQDFWLSAILDKPAFHYQGGPAEVSAALSSLRAKGSAFFCDAKVSAEDASGVAALTKAGFVLADENLYFETLPPRPRTNACPVRPAQAADAEAVALIAEKGFALSRFHRDPHIPRDRADAIKRAWALNYFSGKRGDLMLVAEGETGLAGFTQLIKKPDGLWVIDLIAVQESSRGKGFGADMVRAMSLHCPAITRIGVGTQAVNKASQVFYTKLGFELRKTSYVFHYHGGGR